MTLHNTLSPLSDEWLDDVRFVEAVSAGVHWRNGDGVSVHYLGVASAFRKFGCQRVAGVDLLTGCRVAVGHDLIEDKIVDRDEIRRRWGERVLMEVEALTEWRPDYLKDEPRYYLRQCVKLCDIYDIVTRDLEHTRDSLMWVVTTLTVWAPLAQRLGLHLLAAALEGAAQSFLSRDDHLSDVYQLVRGLENLRRI